MIFKKQYLHAGTKIYQEKGATTQAAILLSRASNAGHIEALLPLGQLFEERDNITNATLVYNVLEGRSRYRNPYLHATVSERLEMLKQPVLRHYPDTVVEPVRLHVNDTILIIKPPKDIPVIKHDVRPARVENDKHNVHDSSVVKSVAATVKKLKQQTQLLISLPNTLIQVRQLCNGNAKAERVLNRIESSTDTVTSLNSEKEVNILHLVWNRICSQNYDESVKKRLVESLAECVENDSVVCTNGRVSRIVDTLNIVDPVVSIKPRWAVRREILEIASNLRKEYSDGDVELFKTALREKCKKEYVDTALISQPMLDEEINSWIDTI